MSARGGRGREPGRRRVRGGGEGELIGPGASEGG